MHYELVKEFYNKYLDRIEMPLYLNRNLKAPNFDKYLLTTGGKIISNHKFLGLDLSSFVSYSAFTNQFFNAKLVAYKIYNSEMTEEEVFTIIDDSFENMSRFLNPSEVYMQVMSELNSPISPELHRKASKSVLKRILDHEPNIDHLNPNSLSLVNRFILAYFNNFENPNPQGIERKIKDFMKLAEKNLFEHRNKKYFRKYEDSRIFMNTVQQIKTLIYDLRQITPLDKKIFDFFRYNPQESSGQTEKRFYKFIISLQYETESKQITINGFKTRVISIKRAFHERSE